MGATPLVILMREAQASHYKQMGLKDCARQDHNLGIKEKLTGWGVVSKDRHIKKISRSNAIRGGYGKNGGKIGKN